MKQLEVMWGLNSHECVYTRTLFTVWTHCSQEVILHVFGGHGACNCLLEVCSTDFLGDLLGKLLCKKTPWRWTCTHCHILKDKRQGPAVQHRGLCPMWCGSLDGRGVWGRVLLLCPSLCTSINSNTPGFSVLHYFPEVALTHVY